MKKRKFDTYQVDDQKLYGGVKLVSELTEDEAKNELCGAMDLVGGLQSLIHNFNLDVEALYSKHNY